MIRGDMGQDYRDDLIKRRYDPTNLFHLNHNIPPF